MSSTFDFLMVLYSIIIGVSMSQILTAIGNVIQSNKPIGLYWVHNSWVVFIFYLHIFLWFSAWEYGSIEIWSLGDFLMFLTIPVVLFIVSVVTLPNIDPDKTYDLRTYYYKNCRALHVLIILVIVLTSANEYLLLHETPFTLRNTARFGAVITLLIGFFFPNPKVHRLEVVPLFIFLGYFSLSYRDSIGG